MKIRTTAELEITSEHLRIALRSCKEPLQIIHIIKDAALALTDESLQQVEDFMTRRGQRELPQAARDFFSALTVIRKYSTPTQEQGETGEAEDAVY